MIFWCYNIFFCCLGTKICIFKIARSCVETYIHPVNIQRISDFELKKFEFTKSNRISMFINLNIAL